MKPSILALVMLWSTLACNRSRSSQVETGVTLADEVCACKTADCATATTAKRTEQLMAYTRAHPREGHSDAELKARRADDLKLQSCLEKLAR